MTNTNTPTLDSKVERIAKDYTGGRTGQVIEIKENRARVHWTKTKNGSNISLRTWVRFQDLKVLETPAPALSATEAEFEAWMDAKKAQVKAWVEMGERGELKDDLNPVFMFITMPTELLAKIISGEICASFMAAREMANRGLDKNGNWVGFEQAEKIHFA